ncbi:MAG TPA: DUF302 domain-containing protein [Acidimicrobiales bacterium]|nr:DUF302 domain-containing protein [Acidimicrobiales bacterium]
MDAIETVVPLDMGEAEEAVRAALGAQGFGVLTEIDVAATLKARLGVDRSPLKILGACNPQIAHRALEIDPSASLLLPCNVVLEPAASGTRVAMADPRALMGGGELSDLAEEAARLLVAVAGSLPAA